jgi:hypothetical protein
MHDFNRGLATLLGAGIAGGLVWVAGAYVGHGTVGRFWASMGIVAGAGLVLALMRMTGGLSRGMRPYVSPGVFLFAFVPVLVVVAWTLLATQPASGWEHGTIVSYSGSIGVMHLIRDIAVYDAVLAFGLGMVLGLSFGSVPVEREVVVDRYAHDGVAADEPMAGERTSLLERRTVEHDVEQDVERPASVADHTYTRVE